MDLKENEVLPIHPLFFFFPLTKCIRLAFRFKELCKMGALRAEPEIFLFQMVSPGVAIGFLHLLKALPASMACSDCNIRRTGQEELSRCPQAALPRTFLVWGRWTECRHQLCCQCTHPAWHCSPGWCVPAQINQHHTQCLWGKKKKSPVCSLLPIHGTIPII